MSRVESARLEAGLNRNMRVTGIDVRHRPQPTPTAAESAQRRWPVPLCLTLILVIYLAQVWYFHGYINDDAYITFRYSRSLAEGLGPYYNLDQHVEGYSSPTMMLLIAAVIRLAGVAAAPVAAKTVGVVSGALCILLVFWFTRILGRWLGLNQSAALWGLGAAALVAINPGFALNATSGLETGLFALLLILGCLLSYLETHRRKWHGSGLVFALAILTRPEGVVLFGLLWLTQAGILQAARLRPDPLDSPLISSAARRHLIINALTVASVVAIHLALRHILYDGEWLPNTYYAKLGGFLHYQVGSYIADGVLPAILGPLGLVAALVGLALYRRDLWRLLPLIAVASVGCLLPLWTGKDWMPGYRLVMPHLPLVACLVLLGWASLVSKLARRQWWTRAAAIAVALTALALLQNGSRAQWHRYVDIRATGFKTGHLALVDWLNRRTSTEGGPVALMDIGLIGYYCPDRCIIDITGLTDRVIAKSEGGFLAKKYDPEYVLAQHPEFIVLTLTESQSPENAPSSPASLRFWTPIERRLYYSPEFQDLYVNKRASTPIGGHFASVARRFGAERIFAHAYPDASYLLAIFRRHPEHLPERHAGLAP